MLERRLLNRALSWYQDIQPTAAWAERYGGESELVASFLDASKRKTDRWWWLPIRHLARNIDSRPTTVSPQRATTARPSLASQIFVSYSHHDEATALKIVQQPEAHGFKCWIACRDVPAGTSFGGEIVKNLKSAHAVLLVFSSRANISQEIEKELALTSKYQRFLLPVRIDDAEPTEAFEYQLANRQMIDLLDWKQNLPLLIEALRDRPGSVN